MTLLAWHGVQWVCCTARVPAMPLLPCRGAACRSLPSRHARLAFTRHHRHSAHSPSLPLSCPPARSCTGHLGTEGRRARPARQAVHPHLDAPCTGGLPNFCRAWRHDVDSNISAPQRAAVDMLPAYILSSPAQTANAGASSLQLQDPVKSWEAGQQAVVTTTIWKDEQVGGLAALAMHGAMCSSLVGSCTRQAFDGLGRGRHGKD